MVRVGRLGILTIAAILLSSAASKASSIQWGYDWSPTQSFLNAGSGQVTFSDEGYLTAAGNSHVVATQLQLFSTANPLTPDAFGAGDGNYSLTVTLTDIDSGQSGSLTFTGKLQGTFSEFSANVSNTFNSPTVQSILLGYTTFIVTMDSYTPPGPPEQSNFGSIGALIEVSSLKPAEETPEPSTMALAGLGAGIAGFGAWRRRRQQKTA